MQNALKLLKVLLGIKVHVNSKNAQNFFPEKTYIGQFLNGICYKNVTAYKIYQKCPVSLTCTLINTIIAFGKKGDRFL